MDIKAKVAAQTNIVIASAAVGMTVDGQAIYPYDTIFLAGQTAAAENGPYTMQPNGKLLRTLASFDGTTTIEIAGGTFAGYRYQYNGTTVAGESEFTETTQDTSQTVDFVALTNVPSLSSIATPSSYFDLGTSTLAPSKSYRVLLWLQSDTTTNGQYVLSNNGSTWVCARAPELVANSQCLDMAVTALNGSGGGRQFARTGKTLATLQYTQSGGPAIPEHTTILTANNGTTTSTQVVDNVLGSAITTGAASYKGCTAFDGLHALVPLSDPTNQIQPLSRMSLTAAWTAGTPVACAGNPTAVAISRKGDFAAVACYDDNNLKFFSRSGDTWSAYSTPSLATGSHCMDVAMADDGLLGVAANVGAGTVSIFVVSYGVPYVLVNVTITGGASGVAIDPTGNHILVATSGTTVVPVDLIAGTWTAGSAITVGSGASHVAISRDGVRAIVASATAKTLTQLRWNGSKWIVAADTAVSVTDGCFSVSIADNGIDAVVGGDSAADKATTLKRTGDTWAIVKSFATGTTPKYAWIWSSSKCQSLLTMPSVDITLAAGTPFMSPGSGGFDDNQSEEYIVRSHPTDPSKIMLYYSGAFSVGNAGIAGIGIVIIPIATFLDKTTWVKYSGNPIVGSVAGVANYRLDSIVDVGTIGAGGTRYMYCTNQVTLTTVDLFTSTDGFTFTKHASSPVLSPGGTNGTDETIVSQMAVIKDGATWRTVYSYRTEAASLPGLRYATSSDGITWAKQGEIISKAAGTPYSTYFEWHQLLKRGSTYIVTGECFDGKFWTACMWWSTDLSTWTPCSKSPISLIKQGYHLATPGFEQVNGVWYLLYQYTDTTGACGNAKQWSMGIFELNGHAPEDFI